MGFHTFESGRRPPAPPMSEINVTPLVDVMLVLLVIFIVAAPIMASAIRLDLPKTAAARPSESPRVVTLVVPVDGVVRVDEQPLDDAALLAHLRTVAGVHADTEVQLRADAQVPYGRVVALIGMAQQAGLIRVGFVAAEPTSAVPAAR